MPKYLPTPYPHEKDNEEMARKDSIDSTNYCPSTYSSLIRRISIDSDPGSVMLELLEYNRGSELSNKIQTQSHVVNSNPILNTTNNTSNEKVDLKEVSLKFKVTEMLQNVTKRYMKNQQDILNAKQITMDRLKQVDTHFEKQKEILNKHFRINQEKLQRRFQENLEKTRIYAENSRTKYQTNLDRLDELGVKNQKDYVESQENILMHYRKIAKKRIK